ncbi:MAG: methyltransferase domain-containing protein [Nitrospirota bacterium]
MDNAEQTTAGFRQALCNLEREFSVMRKHSNGLVKARSYYELNALKLNLGCGPHLKDGWVNVDLNDNADITLDLREPLPLRDCSCSIIYSEHFLEHIDYPDNVTSLLKECYRILEPGGTFSAGVPDTEWPLLEYAGILQLGYFEKAKTLWHPKWCETDMEHINHHFRQGTEHRFAYDFRTLKHILTKTGFVEVTRRKFDPQRDNKSRELGTLYVDARKPMT